MSVAQVSSTRNFDELVLQHVLSL